jgi:chromate transporter
VSGRILALLGVFAPLSLVTFGGGQAVVADYQRQVVEVHHWMTHAEFVNAFAISRMAPGPGSLLVTLIGWQVAGAWGALVASVAIFGPTAVLMLGVAQLWRRYRGALVLRAIEGGLRPVAAGMVLAAVYVLLRSLDGGWLARGLAFAATGVLMTTRIGPVPLLVLGAGVFVAARIMGWQ